MKRAHQGGRWFIPRCLGTQPRDPLMAENRARMNKLTAALDTVDERVRGLRRRSNRLRQEEIAQGIELILLSAGAR